MPAHVASVNLGTREPNPAKTVGVTGIRKRPVDAATLRAPGPKRGGLGSGLVDDFIGDVRHHGGDFQAVYAFAREELDSWEAPTRRRARQRVVRREPHHARSRRRRLPRRRPVGGRRRGGARGHRPADPLRDLRRADGHPGLGEDVRRRGALRRVPRGRDRRRGAAGRRGPGGRRDPGTTSTCRPRSGRSWATSRPPSTCWPSAACPSTSWPRCATWSSGAGRKVLDPLPRRIYR